MRHAPSPERGQDLFGGCPMAQIATAIADAQTREMATYSAKARECSVIRPLRR